VQNNLLLPWLSTFLVSRFMNQTYNFRNKLIGCLKLHEIIQFYEMLMYFDALTNSPLIYKIDIPKLRVKKQYFFIQWNKIEFFSLNN
jgi:hypothetical protein